MADKEQVGIFSVLIKDRNGSTRVRAKMPEDGVSIAIEQEYEDPFKIDINPYFRAAFTYFNKKLRGEERAAVWNRDAVYTYMGGSPLQMSLELLFEAETSIELDIVDPIRNLIKFSLPSGGNTNRTAARTSERLREQGGTLRDIAAEATEQIKSTVVPPTSVDISIGRILYLQKAVITNVSPQFRVPFLSSSASAYKGMPSTVPVTINIQTSNMLTKEEVDGIFFQQQSLGG